VKIRHSNRDTECSAELRAARDHRLQTSPVRRSGREHAYHVAIAHGLRNPREVERCHEHAKSRLGDGQTIGKARILVAYNSEIGSDSFQKSTRPERVSAVAVLPNRLLQATSRSLHNGVPKYECIESFP
jgi:hypothetical protein